MEFLCDIAGLPGMRAQGNLSEFDSAMGMRD
jgi:hypothetical protein